MATNRRAFLTGAVAALPVAAIGAEPRTDFFVEGKFHHTTFDAPITAMIVHNGKLVVGLQNGELHFLDGPGE